MEFYKTIMKKILKSILFLLLISCSAFAQKAEQTDSFLGDWKWSGGDYFAQVFQTTEGVYTVNIRKDLTSLGTPVAVLTGEKSDDILKLNGDEWSGEISDGKLLLTNGNEKMQMEHFYRSSPTMGEKPPKDAIVLFDGKNFDQWAKLEFKEWLKGSGPVESWKITEDGAMEVVPEAGSIITKQVFGDIHLHFECRLLGEKTNGGIYFMSRYEINIKDSYGQVGGSPNGSFGNISKPKDKYPSVNMAYPTYEWQSFDIDFRAPRFDKAGTTKIENARISIVHNGVQTYKDVEMEAVKGATGVLGEAGVGPIYLQEHGTAYQFRNIWVIDKTVKGTENAKTLAQPKAKKGGNKAGGNKSKGEGETTSAAKTSTEVVAPAGKKKGSNGKNVEASYDEEKNPYYADRVLNTLPDLSGKPAKDAGFHHPGILVNQLQLEELKKRVADGVEPQKSAFAALKESPYGALDYAPQPTDTVSCGPRSTPNIGCKDEQRDCAAAYSQALLWNITGEEAYAKKAIEIMNAWSYTLVGGHNYANGPVQSAWCGSVWPRAAEIIRHTYKGWSDKDIIQFQNMLRTQYLPWIMHGDCENGNKELAMSEALINIGVFIEDRATFDLGVEIWRKRTPAYIYLEKDGPTPIEPPGCGPAFWSNKGIMPELVNGILQETARDAHHPGMGFASISNAAETALLQGVDLYDEEGDRITAALEFTAQYLKPNDVPTPENLKFSLLKTWEIAFNHYKNRLGYELPMMTKVIPTNRPTGVDHHMVWETLTHGEMGDIGILMNSEN